MSIPSTLLVRKQNGEMVKTRKLKCIITDRVLSATAEYYSKKLEKAGSEDELHRTYICKEARDLLLKGYGVDQIQKELGAPANMASVPADIIDQVTTNEYGLKRNTMFTELTSFTHQETDPEVRSFINNL